MIKGKAMLTIFTCPKSFSGHTGIIQRNAIRSWTLLRPSPEIILIGDDKGTDIAARKYGIRCFKDVRKNKQGTPLISSIFQLAQSLANKPILCYVNADIIMMNDLSMAVERVLANGMDSFLLVGRRRTVDIRETMTFEDRWEKALRCGINKNKMTLGNPAAIDYMVFPKGLFKNIPDFAVGRPRWDNWMLWYAANSNVPIIDCTGSLFAVHQNHDYSHLGQNGVRLAQSVNPEQVTNENLIGQWWPLRLYTIWDADYILTADGLSKATAIRKTYCRARRIADCAAVALKKYVPFSRPLYVCGKWVKNLLDHLCRAAIDRTT